MTQKIKVHQYNFIKLSLIFKYMIFNKILSQNKNNNPYKGFWIILIICT